MEALLHGQRLAQGMAGGGFVRVDAAGPLPGVFAAQQLIHRDIHKVRVAQIAGPILVGPAHGFHDQVGVRFAIELAENIEGLAHHNATGGGRRCRNDTGIFKGAHGR